jgi:hypothetical protein
MSILIMKTRDLIVAVHESEFGASTQANFQMTLSKDNVWTVLDVIDTSDNETNYSWDGWHNQLDSFIGLTEEELMNRLEKWFVEFPIKENCGTPYFHVYACENWNI